MSPDLRLRRRINQTLRDRPSRTVDEWYDAFWDSLSVSKEVAAFVYLQMQVYSGLNFAQVLPDDRLTEDLNLPLVCWFDWELTLCEDFFEQFGVDITQKFELCHLATVKEFVVFLNQQLLPVNYS